MESVGAFRTTFIISPKLSSKWITLEKMNENVENFENIATNCHTMHIPQWPTHPNTYAKHIIIILDLAILPNDFRLKTFACSTTAFPDCVRRYRWIVIPFISAGFRCLTPPNDVLIIIAINAAQSPFYLVSMAMAKLSLINISHATTFAIVPDIMSICVQTIRCPSEYDLFQECVRCCV